MRNQCLNAPQVHPPARNLADRGWVAPRTRADLGDDRARLLEDRRMAEETPPAAEHAHHGPPTSARLADQGERHRVLPRPHDPRDPVPLPRNPHPEPMDEHPESINQAESRMLRKGTSGSEGGPGKPTAARLTGRPGPTPTPTSTQPSPQDNPCDPRGLRLLHVRYRHPRPHGRRSPRQSGAARERLRIRCRGAAPSAC